MNEYNKDKEKARQNVDYGYDIQRVYLEMMLADAGTFVRCQSIFDSKLFDRRLQTSAEYLTKYVSENNVLPTADIINAATGSNLKAAEDLREEHFEWLLNDFETFTRHKGLEQAILESADLLEKGEYGQWKKRSRPLCKLACNETWALTTLKIPEPAWHVSRTRMVRSALGGKALMTNCMVDSIAAS